MIPDEILKLYLGLLKKSVNHQVCTCTDQCTGAAQNCRIGQGYQEFRRRQIIPFGPAFRNGNQCCDYGRIIQKCRQSRHGEHQSQIAAGFRFMVIAQYRQDKAFKCPGTLQRGTHNKQESYRQHTLIGKPDKGFIHRNHLSRQ